LLSTQLLNCQAESHKDLLLDGQDFGSYDLNLKLIKSLQTEDLVYHNSLTVKYTDRPLYVKAWFYLTQRPCMLAMFVLLILFVVFLIIAIAMKTKLGNKKPAKIWVPLIILTVIFILAIVFVVYKAGPPRSIYPAVAPSEDKLDIVWAEDTTETINLSGYFDDPDQDVLKYVVSNTDHIDIDVVGEMAYLVPAKDWSGQEVVVFEAFDQKGGVAMSPVMLLTVVDMPEYTFRQQLEHYCGYLNLVLLFFVLLFVFIMFYKKAGSGRATKAQKEAIAEAEKKNGNGNSANKKNNKNKKNSKKKK